MKRKDAPGGMGTFLTGKHVGLADWKEKLIAFYTGITTTDIPEVETEIAVIRILSVMAGVIYAPASLMRIFSRVQSS